MAPLLVLVFGIHPATAVGTDLLYAAATKGVGTLAHNHKGSVDWRIVGRLACGSVPGAAITLTGLHLAGAQTAQVSHVITILPGVALMVTALATFFRNWTVRHRTAWLGEMSEQRAIRLTVASGLSPGVVVSISSVGAGAIGVTVMIVLYAAIPLMRIIGSDIAHAVPLTLLAGFGHLAMGNVDCGLVKSLLVGSVHGTLIGNLKEPRLPEPALRPALASVLLLVGSRLVASQPIRSPAAGRLFLRTPYVAKKEHPLRRESGLSL